jgi:glycosyltransferase involved in cell wall biosynthesis
VVCAIAEAMPEQTFQFLIRWESDSVRADLEKVQRLSNVKIRRYPYAEKLTNLIRDARVVALPFRTTSAILPPFTVVEAMALGKCVITTDLPGMEDLVDTPPTLVMVPKGSVQDALRAAQDLFTHPSQIAEIGEEAKKKIQSAFSTQYNPFQSLYNQLLT